MDFLGMASCMKDIEGHIRFQGGEVEDIKSKLQEMEGFQASTFEELMTVTLDTKCRLQEHAMPINEQNETQFAQLKEILE